jgi:hypothetical protein
MNEKEIKKILSRMDGIFVPEFTWKDRRIDAIVIDIRHRWVRGFEIKTDRTDFLQDKKFLDYSEFCSSFSFVCPSGLIKPEEVDKPIGLLWIEKDIDAMKQSYYGYSQFQWKKRPGNFQRRKSLSWLWTYLKVLELEMPRMYYELNRLKEWP